MLCSEYTAQGQHRPSNFCLATLLRLCCFVAQQKLPLLLCCATKVALKFFTRNFYHATSNPLFSCTSSRIWEQGATCRLYGSKCTQLRKLDNKSIVGAFGAITAVLVLCACIWRRNRGEWTREWVSRRPGFRIHHRLVHQELHFSHEAWYRRFFGWMQPLSTNWWPCRHGWTMQAAATFDLSYDYSHEIRSCSILRDLLRATHDRATSVYVGLKACTNG